MIEQDFQTPIKEIMLSKGEKLIDTVKAHVRVTMPTLNGKEDPIPMLYLRRGHVVQIAAILPSFYGSQSSKNALGFVILPKLAMDFKAEEFAFMTPAWIINRPIDTIDKEHPPLPSAQADRKEIIIVTTGDGEHQTVYMGDIHRGAQHPFVDKWELSPLDADVTGRMFESLRDAMLYNHSPNDELLRRIAERAL